MSFLGSNLVAVDVMLHLLLLLVPTHRLLLEVNLTPIFME